MSSEAKPRIVLLMPPDFGAQLGDLARSVGLGPVVCVNSREALAAAFARATPRVLLAFSTGAVVPAEFLDREGIVAANVHGASPAYPGRDPHHFAAYEGATQYGATLHYMVPAVDQGPVIRVSLEEVPPSSHPVDLMAVGVKHGLQLAKGFLMELAAGRRPLPDPRLRWTGPVRRRRDFLALCRITPTIDAAEFDRRLRATSMPGHRNLVLEFQGRTFRLEDERPE